MPSWWKEEVSRQEDVERIEYTREARLIIAQRAQLRKKGEVVTGISLGDFLRKL